MTLGTTRTVKMMEALRKTVEVRVWQWILNWGVMLTLVFGGIFGLARYVQDQRADADRQAVIAQYENDRDTHTQCVQRATTRDDLRGVLFALTQEFSGGDAGTLERARAVVDSGYPKLNQDDCPPSPAYPFADEGG